MNTSGVILTGKTLSFDLNGYTLSYSGENSGAISCSGASLTLMDGAGGGQIKATATLGSAFHIEDAAALTVAGGLVLAENGPAAVNTTTGALVVTGGRVEAKGANPAIVSHGPGSVSITGGEVAANDAPAIYNAGTGKITVRSGSGLPPYIGSNYNHKDYGTIYLKDGIPGATVLEIAGGTIENSQNQACSAVYNDGPGTVLMSGGLVKSEVGYTIANAGGVVKITGGRVETVHGTAVWNDSTGSVSLSDNAELISAEGIGLFNRSTGSVTITGGNISTETGSAVFSDGPGPIEITGGTMEATKPDGQAIYHGSTGKITIGQAPGASTSINSVNTNEYGGTINVAKPETQNLTLLEITGGIVTNTASGGRAIRQNAMGRVSVSGGRIMATKGGTAIENLISGEVSISGGGIHNNHGGAAIVNAQNGRITVTGGSIESIDKGSGSLTNGSGTPVVRYPILYYDYGKGVPVYSLSLPGISTYGTQDVWAQDTVYAWLPAGLMGRIYSITSVGEFFGCGFDAGRSATLYLWQGGDHAAQNPPSPENPIDLSKNFTQGFGGSYAELLAIRLNGNLLRQTATGPTAETLSAYPGYSLPVGETASGSVMVTLYKEFLQTLPSGKYTLELEFAAVNSTKTTSSMQFTVLASPSSSSGSSGSVTPPPGQPPARQNPQTGDSLDLWPLLALAAVAVCCGGAAVLVKLRGKKKGAESNSEK